MPRKAARLPPATTSVEEVLLSRMAGVAAASAPATAARPRPRPHHGPRPAGSQPASAGAAATDALAALAVADASCGEQAGLEALRAFASDVERLDARLQLLAARAPASPSATAGGAAAAVTGAAAAGDMDALLADGLRALQQQPPQSPQSRARVDRQARAAASGAAAGAQVALGVRALRATVRRLDRVFLEAAPGAAQRQQAATRLSALARGFAARRRFSRLRAALGRWRARGCAPLLAHVELFSAREAFRGAQVARMREARALALLRRALAALRDAALLRLPERARQRDECARRFQAKQRALLLSVWSPWRAEALGPRSRKQLARAARERHLAARARLEASGRFELVTPAMVHEEALRANVRAARAAHAHHVLRQSLRLLRDEVLRPRQQRWAAAAAHARRAALARVWAAWMPVFRAQQVDKALAASDASPSPQGDRGDGDRGDGDGDREDGGRDAGGREGGGGRQRSRGRGATLARFDKPVNMRRVDAHCRRATLRRHVRAWRARTALLRRARARFAAAARAALALRLARWRVRARYQRALRLHALEQWRAYGRRVFQTPFRAWFARARAAQARRAAQAQVCAAFARRARRQRKYAVFRLWKHQALFGAAEGALPRLALLRALEEQKRLSLSLEANAALLREHVAALRQAGEQLEDKLLGKQQELARAHQDAQSARFALHAAEQAVARANALADALRRAHPGSAARIERALGEQPLLAADLRDVLARHAATRQELLASIARDAGAAQVVAAAPRAALGGDDQLLLHRVKWLLSRLDLRGEQEPEDSRAAVGQLCALFEFLRDGDASALAPENDPERGGGRALASRTGSGQGGEGQGGGGQGDGRVTRADLTARREPWSAFVGALTLQFAPDKMRAVKERLLARAQAAADELQALKASPAVYNLYSGSAKPS